METTTTSKKGSLNAKDFLKGLYVTAGLPVVASVYETIQNSIATNTFALPSGTELKHSLFYGLAGGVAYLLKNLMTPSQIVIQDAHPDTIEAVKEGKAEVQVTPK